MNSETGFRVISLNDSDLRARYYTKRKVHKKTKTGCLTCKAKRVKCDETRPVCLRCRRNSWQCGFDQSDNYGTESSRTKAEVHMSNTASFSVLNSVTLVPFYSPSAKNGTSSTHLMQHCQRYWTEIFHMPRSDKIISLSKSDPLVRNTMLAMTACHLRHASPGVLQHRIADHFQQSFALEQYRKALCTPQKDLGQSGIDALLLSAVLLNIIAFALPSSETVSRGDDEPDPRTSSIISLDEDLLGWLSLQAGLRPLLKSMATYLPQTLHFLSLIFLGSNKESWTLMREGQDLEEVPATWREVFELDNAGRTRYDEATGSAGAVDISQNRQGIISSMNPKNIFRLPLLILVQLRNLAPVRFNVFQNLQFLGKVDTELRELVRDKDEKALWLIGYWLGLMCRFEDIWWCEKRAKRDYKAIRTWLEQLHLAERPGVEGRRWKEMMKELELAPVFVPTWMTEL